MLSETCPRAKANGRYFEKEEMGMSIFITIVAVLLAFLYTIALSVEGFATLYNYIDIPSMIILLLLVIPVLISAGMFRDFCVSFKRAFSAQIICTRAELQRSMEAVKLARKSNYAAGIFGFLISFVFVCKGYDLSDAHVFWLNMAVAVIPVIYAVALDLIFLAVYGRLKKRYMDFMQMGYGMPEKEPATTAIVSGAHDIAGAVKVVQDEGNEEKQV